ncbi:LRR 8 domain containing protein [Asbolus verrucosus]|uniref:LRR 8 domain containing protein n=1 Tax=Asbolus verrucosus TaxID=1661398 RepID=A0A482VDU9_ASBVE|nr:LRR 8 domain containing protein [Asbolus verrucosus]
MVTNLAVFEVIILLLPFLTKYGQCRGIWDDGPTYLEVSNLVLEKGKPLVVQQNSTQLQIKGLNGTLYSDSLSQLSQVSDLKIFINQIIDIETGAICSAPKLKRFEIDLSYNAHAPVLTKNMFEGCDNLEELFLVGNYDNLTTLDSDALQSLPNLKYLYIRNFNLKHLTQDYFKGLKSLTNLTLFRCSIEEIDSNAFVGLANLEEVRFEFNGFERLPNSLFKNTPKLVNLLLFGNNITNLTWDEFDGLASLERLELIRNQINTFDGNKITKFMPNLKVLLIEFKTLECDQRKKLNNYDEYAGSHEVLFLYKFGFDPDSCES